MDEKGAVNELKKLKPTLFILNFIGLGVLVNLGTIFYWSSQGMDIMYALVIGGAAGCAASGIFLQLTNEAR